MSKDLIQALEAIKATLEKANQTGVITDTIWHGPGETLWDFIDNTIDRHRSSVESVELDARRYRLLRDFDSADTELAICRWSEHGWCGEWVIEHDPDTEVDKALAKREA